MKGSHVQDMRQENTVHFDLHNVLFIGFSAHLMEMKYLASYSPFNTWILKMYYI